MQSKNRLCGLLNKGIKKGDLHRVVEVLERSPGLVNRIKEDHPYRVISTPLTLAVQTGACEMVRLLLEYGADSDAVGIDDLRPIQLAAKLGHQDIVGILLDAGADVLEETGRKALLLASRYGHAEIASILLSHGVDQDCRYGNYTPLIVASMYSNHNVVRVLIASRAKVDVRDRLGRTPLHYAVEGKDLRSIRMLLAAGASPVRQDKSGETPVDLALSAGYTGIADLLSGDNSV